jgi:hypothetical protein
VQNEHATLLRDPTVDDCDSDSAPANAVDDYISLSAAAKATPGRPSSATVWRWARRGIKARNGQTISLRHVRVGGRVYTKRSWLEKYFAAVAEADNSPRAPQLNPIRDESLPVSHHVADAELREAGL